MYGDGLSEAVRLVFDDARGQFESSGNIQRVYDTALLTGIASLANNDHVDHERYGLVPTLRAAYAFYHTIQPHERLYPPIILDPLFEGREASHWVRLHLLLKDNEDLWKRILSRLGVDKADFFWFSRLSIGSLEEGVAEMYVDHACGHASVAYRYLEMELYKLEARVWLNENANLSPSEWKSTPTALIKQLLSTKLRLADGIFFRLPDWEAVKLIDANWAIIKEGLRK